MSGDASFVLLRTYSCRQACRDTPSCTSTRIPSREMSPRVSDTTPLLHSYLTPALHVLSAHSETRRRIDLNFDRLL